MIDIETMSLHKHKALILSVGLIEFDPRDAEKLHYQNTMLMVPLITPQLLLGRRVYPGTQKFWAEQSQAARNHWEHATVRHSAQEVILTVRALCADKTVWANGSQFDLSNLEGLAEDIGEKEPLWHYQSPRDMRTFVKTTTQGRVVQVGDALDIPGVAHDPIYDCISQAWRVWAHWSL